MELIFLALIAGAGILLTIYIFIESRRATRAILEVKAISEKYEEQIVSEEQYVEMLQEEEYKRHRNKRKMVRE